MKILFTLSVILVTVFVASFIVIDATGMLTIAEIRIWLETAGASAPWMVGLVVMGLLTADLLIAIPNLAVCILSGYLLGFELGALFNILGVLSAGIMGYWLSRSLGRKFLTKIVGDPAKLNEMEDLFQRHGFVMLIIAWALPILPEATACLSGFTRMPFWKFMSAWALGAVPYVSIAAYAGASSTPGDPQPAIYAAIALTVFFWLMWAGYLRAQRRSA